MKKVYIVYPEGDYAARRKTMKRWKCEWYTFCMGNRELWQMFCMGNRELWQMLFGSQVHARRIVVDTKLTNDYAKGRL